MPTVRSLCCLLHLYRFFKVRAHSLFRLQTPEGRHCPGKLLCHVSEAGFSRPYLLTDGVWEETALGWEQVQDFAAAGKAVRDSNDLHALVEPNLAAARSIQPVVCRLQNSISWFRPVLAVCSVYCSYYVWSLQVSKSPGISQDGSLRPGLPQTQSALCLAEFNVLVLLLQDGVSSSAGW